MRFKFIGMGGRESGYTIIELLIVAAIIGILLAIAIPNLIKARISANEANARKAMQTLRDAEAEFFEQDMDNNLFRDYTNYIGSLALPGTQQSLRCPNNTLSPCTEQDALVDSSFVGALTGVGDGMTATTADCSTAGGADPKAGYCVGWTGDSDDGINAADIAMGDPILQADFGWEASPTSVQKTGRRDYGVWGDGVIRCTASTVVSAAPGTFLTSRDGSGGQLAVGACD